MSWECWPEDDPRASWNDDDPINQPRYDHRDLTRTVRTKIRISETHEHAGQPCWEWTGSCDSSGYANVKMHGRLVLVHRYTYTKLVGPIKLEGDDDATLDHLCKGLRQCVNPAHMEIVSRSENSTRANRRRWKEGYSRNQGDSP